MGNNTQSMLTPKAISLGVKAHAVKMAGESARRNLALSGAIADLELSMQLIMKRVKDFNDVDDNLAVMRVIRSWFSECHDKTSSVALPQQERCAYDPIEIIALREPMLFTGVNGNYELCGGDDEKSSGWGGSGDRLLYFRQWKSFPARPGYEVRLTGDEYNENTREVLFSGRLATAPCVIMSYEDGRIGLGSENGGFPWSGLDVARRLVADGKTEEGSYDVVIANNVRLISAMRRFLDSFKGLTHLVGLKVKCRNEGAENHLRKEIDRYAMYSSRIRNEIERSGAK